MARRNIFETHKKGVDTWKRLLNKLITQKEASEILGTTQANISQIYSKYKKSILSTPENPKKIKQEKKKQIKKTVETIKEQKEMILTLSQADDLDIINSVIWRSLLEGLNKLIERNLDLDDFLKVTKELRYFMQFHFKNQVPEIPKEAIKIDPESEKQLIEKMELICNDCAFRRSEIKEHNDQQEAARTQFVVS